MILDNSHCMMLMGGACLVYKHVLSFIRGDV